MAGIGVDLVGLLGLVVVGVIVIVLVGAFLFLLPAIVVAVIVWLITHDNLLTGIAFLAVALISLARR
jgi:hypothetical protein